MARPCPLRIVLLFRRGLSFGSLMWGSEGCGQQLPSGLFICRVLGVSNREGMWVESMIVGVAVPARTERLVRACGLVGRGSNGVCLE